MMSLKDATLTPDSVSEKDPKDSLPSPDPNVALAAPLASNDSKGKCRFGNWSCCPTVPRSPQER